MVGCGGSAITQARVHVPLPPVSDWRRLGHLGGAAEDGADGADRADRAYGVGRADKGTAAAAATGGVKG